MFAIDKEKFGAFVAQLRKEKGLMQKELAEKLYVSDKAVSKWERGLSIPDVALLVPLAEILGVTVTELLECRRIPRAESMDSRQTEELVQKVIGMTAEKPRGGGWKQCRALLACAAVGCLELFGLWKLGIGWEEMGTSLGVIMPLMGIFGLYFCVFVPQKLPKYYDENRLQFFADGPLRMNLPGVYFNNNNWPHILRVVRLWAMLGLAVSPAVYFLVRMVWPEKSGFVILFLTLGGLFIPIVVLGRKYEFVPEKSRR